ncbi:MAG: transposase [Cyclobacteriaceae bacterium]
MKTIILGIDVSKNTLDIAVMIAGSLATQHQIDNTSKSFQRWLKQLTKDESIELSDCMICMEHTGVYCHPVIAVCDQLGCFLWVEDAGRIKAFHSLSRGKNDALDAERIATYAFLKQSEAKKMGSTSGDYQGVEGIDEAQKKTARYQTKTFSACKRRVEDD